MEEERYMVCVPTSEIDDPVEGSTTTACVDCGQDIWISAESRKEMHAQGAMPLCTLCAGRLASERPVETRGRVAEEMGFSSGQLGEILQGLQNRGGMPSFLRKDPDDDTFETMKETARAAGEKMTHPDEDWGSMVVMEDFNDVVYPPLPLGKLIGLVPKEVLARQLIPGLAHTSQAKRVMFGMSSWTIPGEKMPEVKDSISAHPDREEKLVLIEVTADGVQRMSHAEIVRDGVGPPRLGEWHDSEKPEASEGLFVDALVPALLLIRSMREGSTT